MRDSFGFCCDFEIPNSLSSSGDARAIESDRSGSLSESFTAPLRCWERVQLSVRVRRWSHVEPSSESFSAWFGTRKEAMDRIHLVVPGELRGLAGGIFSK